MVNSDGSNLVQLTGTGTSNDSPAWSPDGTKIAVVGLHHGGWDVYVMNPDHTSRVVITFTGDVRFGVSWTR